MSDSLRDGSDDRHVRQLVDDLGRLARAKQARGEDSFASYPRPDPTRTEALVDALCGPEKGSGPQPFVAIPKAPPPPPAEPAEIPRGSTASWLGYAFTAVATAAAVLLVTRLAGSPAPPEVSDPSASLAQAPPFGTWHIDGGGPPVAHQGDPEPSSATVVCSGREFRLVLAVSPGAEIDRSLPLRLTLVATHGDGTRNQNFFEVETDERIGWSTDGGALLLRESIDALLPLHPGTWVLEPRIGTRHACTPGANEPSCTALDAMTIEVDGERCRAAP